MKKQTSYWRNIVMPIAVSAIVGGLMSYLVWDVSCNFESRDLKRRVEEIEKQIPILHKRITDATR